MEVDDKRMLENKIQTDIPTSTVFGRFDKIVEEVSVKKILIAMAVMSNLLLGQDLKIENLNLRNNTDMAYNQFLENQYLILNLPIKIKFDNQIIYVRFQDIKAISVSKDELKCTIIYHGSNSGVRAVIVKDYETRKFIIELFEKQREQIHDALKYGR